MPRKPIIAFRALPLAVLCVLLLFWALLPPAFGQAAASGPPTTGKVSGRVLGLDEGKIPAGAMVELIRFTMDAQGKLAGKTVAETPLDATGAYAFDAIVLGGNAVYKVAVKAEGVSSSSPFILTPEKPVLELDIQIQKHTSASRETGMARGELRISEAVVFVEPIRARVWVTEAVHIDAPPGGVSREGRPLELSIPKDAEDFEMIQEIKEGGSHQRLGEKLLVHGDLPPGRTSVVFRYRLSAFFGAAEIAKRYPLPTHYLSVLYPQGTLRLKSEGFSPRDDQTIQGKIFHAWSRENVAAGSEVELTVSGVPFRQEIFLLALALFLPLAGGILVWFLVLRKPDSPASV